MKEEDVSNSSRMLPLTTPTVASYSGPSVPKAYVSDDPEHVDDCSNCGLSHGIRDREGADVKAKKNFGRNKSTETDKDTIDWTCNVPSPPIKIEIKVTIKMENSAEGEEKPKKKASRDEMRRCFYCDGIGHLQRHCSKRIEDKRQGKIRPYKKSNKKVTRTRVEVVSNPGDYDNEGEADSDWYQGRD